MLRITRHPPPTKWRGVLTDPIWIYRGLMRQTRALYDDVAREYFRQYIRRMFIGHKYVEQNTRLVTYIREARQGILLLARANAGYIGPLSKVLDLAYGRIGKRRHELLEPICSYGKPAVTHDDPRFKLPYLSVKMRALLEWAKVRGVAAKIPETNIWDLPFPKKREPRVYQLAHRRLKEACPAPLPMDEYKRLKRLAAGDELPTPSPRRVEPKLVADMKAGRHQQDNYPGRPREMSARSWRRMWTKVLVKTPALQYNESSNSWDVVSTEPDIAMPGAEKDEVDLQLEEERQAIAEATPVKKKKGKAKKKK